MQFFTKNIKKHLTYLLFVGTQLGIMLVPSVTAAAQAPQIKPVLDFPGSEIIITIISVIMGIIALGMIVLFFVSLAQLASAVRGKRDGGAATAGAGMIASAVVFIIVFAGTAFLNRWVTFLG
jgi:hypothetical protein